MCIREAGLSVCLEDANVNSGVGREWYGGTSQARDNENY